MLTRWIFKEAFKNSNCKSQPALSDALSLSDLIREFEEVEDVNRYLSFQKSVSDHYKYYFDVIVRKEKNVFKITFRDITDLV